MRQRVVEQDGREGVLLDVAPGLVEELAGEGHVVRIDVVDLGQVGDVRLPVPRAGGDDGRDDALEAGLKILEPDRHGATSAECDRCRVLRRQPTGRRRVLASARTGPRKRSVTVKDGQ